MWHNPYGGRTFHKDNPEWDAIVNEFEGMCYGKTSEKVSDRSFEAFEYEILVRDDLGRIIYDVYMLERSTSCINRLFAIVQNDYYPDLSPNLKL